MSRKSFGEVVKLLEKDPLFTSNGYKPQRPVEEQLATFLMRCSGKTSIFAATDTAIAEGTSYLYCARVRTAILNLRDQFLSWPGPQRRKYLKTKMEEYGFPGCIGILDATLIPLAEKPAENGWSYWCRNKR